MVRRTLQITAREFLHSERGVPPKMCRNRSLPAIALCLALSTIAGCATAPPEVRSCGAALSLPAMPGKAPKTGLGGAHGLPAGPIETRFEAAVYDLVNEERLRRGLKALALREDLVAVARRHALDMAARRYFSHFTPDGLDPGDRAAANGVAYAALAENLARVRESERPGPLALDGWLRSPLHRRNLLDEGSRGFESTGVGVAIAPDGAVLVVQLFCLWEDRQGDPGAGADRTAGAADPTDLARHAAPARPSGAKGRERPPSDALAPAGSLSPPSREQEVHRTPREVPPPPGHTFGESRGSPESSSQDRSRPRRGKS
jgi:uncharacterized protein YkwD